MAGGQRSEVRGRRSEVAWAMGDDTQVSLFVTFVIFCSNFFRLPEDEQKGTKLTKEELAPACLAKRPRMGAGRPLCIAVKPEA